jgi:hypothetical protein
METKVLTQEEIQSLKTLQENQSSLVTALGDLEYQITILETRKQFLKNEIVNQIESEVKIGKELQEKYGEGNINLEKGEFTPIL